jgi:hypothetical protein
MVNREWGLLAEHAKSFDVALEFLSSAMAAFDALPNLIELAATFLAVARVAMQLGFPAGYDRQLLVEGVRNAARIFVENRLPRRVRETQVMLDALGADAIHRPEGGEQAET